MTNTFSGALQVQLDAAIRADCELLAAWEEQTDFLNAEDRRELLTFVLNRRGAIEWPAWAAAWVANE